MSRYISGLFLLLLTGSARRKAVACTSALVDAVRRELFERQVTLVTVHRCITANHKALVISRMSSRIGCAAIVREGSECLRGVGGRCRRDTFTEGAAVAGGSESWGYEGSEGEGEEHLGGVGGGETWELEEGMGRCSGLYWDSSGSGQPRWMVPGFGKVDSSLHTQVITFCW